MTTYTKNSMSLIDYLNAFGVKHGHFAARTGISKSYFSNLLNGRDRPSKEWIDRVVTCSDGYVNPEIILDWSKKLWR